MLYFKDLMYLKPETYFKGIKKKKNQLCCALDGMSLWRLYDLDTNAFFDRVLYEPQLNLLVWTDDRVWLCRVEVLRVFESIYLII